MFRSDVYAGSGLESTREAELEKYRYCIQGEEIVRGEGPCIRPTT